MKNTQNLLNIELEFFTEIGVKSFQGLIQLEELYLESNNIDTLDSDLFNGLMNL